MKVINLLCFSSKNPKRQHLDLIQKKAFSFSPSTSRVNTNWDRCGLELNQPQNDSHPPLLTKNYRGNTASSTNTCPHRSSPQTAPPGLTASLTANTQSYRVSMGRRLRRANQTVEKNGELPWSLPEPRWLQEEEVEEKEEELWVQMLKKPGSMHRTISRLPSTRRIQTGWKGWMIRARSQWEGCLRSHKVPGRQFLLQWPLSSPTFSTSTPPIHPTWQCARAVGAPTEGCPQPWSTITQVRLWVKVGVNVKGVVQHFGKYVIRAQKSKAEQCKN